MNILLALLRRLGGAVAAVRADRGDLRRAGSLAQPLRPLRAVHRGPVAGRRAAAAGFDLLAGHRPARPRPVLAAGLRRAHLALHRPGCQRPGGADRHPGRAHRRLRARLAGQRADALYRPDDGLPGAAAGDRAGGDLPAERVDRRAGDRHGELGADRPGDLLGDGGPGRARLRRGGAHPRRQRPAHPVQPPAAAPAAYHSGLGHAGHLHNRAAGGDPVVPRRGRTAADAELGQHHLREPDLLHRGALAGVLSGAAIVLLSLAFNLVGDALRDELDPTLSGRR